MIRVRRHVPSFVALAFVAFVVAAWAPGATLPPLPSDPLASPVQESVCTTASAVVDVPAAIEAAFAGPMTKVADLANVHLALVQKLETNGNAVCAGLDLPEGLPTLPPVLPMAAPTAAPTPSDSPSPATTPAPTPVPPQPDSGGISGGTIALVLFTVGVALVGVALNALYRRSQRAA